MSTPATEIYLLRHGRTRMNAKGVLQGRGINPPLDAEGEGQAACVHAWLCHRGLAFDEALSSPLLRARQTAAIALGLPDAGSSALKSDDRLLEMDYGPYEGYDIATHDPAVEAFFQDFEHVPAPAGMEGLDHVQARAASLMHDIARRPANGCAHRILITCHAIILKGFLEELDPSSQGAWWGRFVGNCWLFRAVLPADGTPPAPAEPLFKGDGA